MICYAGIICEQNLMIAYEIDQVHAENNELEKLRMIPGETQGFICTMILRLNIIFYNEEGVISFITKHLRE